MSTLCISLSVSTLCISTHRRKTTNKTECKFYEQLEGVLGGPSGGPKVTYDPEEEEEGEGDEEEEEEELKQEEEDDEDLQILGCPSREVMGGEGDLSWFRFNRVPPPFIPFSRFLALSP